MVKPIELLYAECLRPICKKYKISKTGLDILLFLANNTRFNTAAEIVEVRYMSKSHVSTTIDILVKRGYIRKEEVEEDKRRLGLKLTSKAQPVIEAGEQAQVEFIDVITRGFSNEELDQLYTILERMDNNAKVYLK